MELEYWILIYAGIITTASYFFIKLWMNHKITALKQETKSEGKKSNLDNQLNELIDNAPQLLSQVEMEIQHLKNNNATPQQLASLEGKKKMLLTITNNKEIIQILGKPILSKALQMIERFRL